MDRLSPKKIVALPGEDAAGTRTRSGSSSSPSTNKARKSNSLPLETVEYLKAWMMSPEHIAHPYPTEQEKAQIMLETRIELKQLTNWFVNNRKRYWKPRVETRLPDTSSQGVSEGEPEGVVPTVITPTKQEETVSNLNAFSLGSSFVSCFLETNLAPKISPSVSSSSLSLPCSPARVSDQSVSSETDSVCSTDDESYTARGQQSTEAPPCLLSQTEYVSVHILRPPHGNTPSADDVSILHNVPADLVLKTFVDCPLTYAVPISALSNNQKIQSCRDAEIRKLKFYYLNMFLTAPLTPKRRRQVQEDTTDPNPRNKFRRASLELWRETCTTSGKCYDRDLPSLEEAATLFGFANS